MLAIGWRANARRAVRWLAACAAPWRARRCAPRRPPIRSGRSRWSCRSRRAGRPTSSRAFCRSRSSQSLGQQRHRRQSRRRGRQYRHGPGRARDARRLHAAADLDRDRGQPGAVQEPALRSVQGFRADLGARQRAERAGRASAIPASTRSPTWSRRRRPIRPSSTIRARAPAPSRISPANCSSCAPASRWCTCRSAAPGRPRRRCSPTPSQVGSVALAAAETLIKDGQLRALAVTSEKRWFSLPNVPTMIEAGLSRISSPTPSTRCSRRPACRPTFWRCWCARAAPPSSGRRRASRRARPASRSSPARPSSLRRASRPKIPAVRELVDKAGIKPE